MPEGVFLGDSRKTKDDRLKIPGLKRIGSGLILQIRSPVSCIKKVFPILITTPGELAACRQEPGGAWV
jgi:hypothetical protein